MTPNKQNILSIIFILFFTITNGQEGIVKGKIQDAITNESLPFSSVALKNSAIGTIADANGYFELKVPALPVTLVVSYSGYVTQEVVISSTDKLKIQLEENAVLIAAVEIVGQRISEKPQRISNS